MPRNHELRDHSHNQVHELAPVPSADGEPNGMRPVGLIRASGQLNGFEGGGFGDLRPCGDAGVA